MAISCDCPIPVRGSCLFRTDSCGAGYRAGAMTWGRMRTNKEVTTHNNIVDHRIHAAIKDIRRCDVQEKPLAEQAFKRAERLIDRYDEMTEDGVLCPKEMAEAKGLMYQLYLLVQKTHLSQATGIAMIRMGVRSQRSRRLLGQLHKVA